jgi:flavin reductase (DIM6/NTAB) family NADH-FMN oxidoreductase RutF
MKKSLRAKTIVYPTPVLIVGTYDSAANPNAMTAAWGAICCSSPPCVAVSLRKATYTYSNVIKQGCFTINIPSEKHVHYADYFGMVSGRKTDKFAESGLTPIRSTLINAPYIKEFPFALECKLVQQIEIGLHTQFIGEILDIEAVEELLDENRDVEY